MKQLLGVVATLMFLMIGPLTFAQTTNPADRIVGTYWSPEKDGKIQIYKQGTKYFGKVLSGKKARKDDQNPDPALRSRDVIGANIFENFGYDAKAGEWTDGTIYDPNNGKTYDCKLWLEQSGAVMMARGFIGISLFGRTAKFERVK
jgi:uncharacterized protein (DUF2147 family)